MKNHDPGRPFSGGLGASPIFNTNIVVNVNVEGAGES